MTKPTVSWWQIEIEDDSALSGRATTSLLRTIVKATRLRYAAVQAVEGAGRRLSELRTERGRVLSIEDLLPIADTVVQFDWADFFLTESELQARRISPEDSYEDALPKCHTLVRAVDDTYFYVYSSDPALRTLLVNMHGVEVAKSGKPSELDFPE